MTRVIPLRRGIKQGMHGKDAIAVKRALSKAGFVRWGGFTPIFGPFAARALKKFQRKHGLLVSGAYTRQTHVKLAPYFDAYGAFLMGQIPRPRVGDTRDKIIAGAMLLYNNRVRVHYTMSGKRMQGVRERLRPPKYPEWEDCSSSYTWCFWQAGAPDPNGRGYDGFGYTGTLAQNGRRITLDQAQPGDAVLYGSGPPYQHVAMYLGKGKVWSHGSENGPYILPIDYRGDRREIRTYPMSR
jgi:cell wall-associated NlpC family hydrolase